MSSFANTPEVDNFSSILQVQQYDRAIHIMAMLLIGFGFLMVFVKKYGRSALRSILQVSFMKYSKPPLSITDPYIVLPD